VGVCLLLFSRTRIRSFLTRRPTPHGDETTEETVDSLKAGKAAVYKARSRLTAGDRTASSSVRLRPSELGEGLPTPAALPTPFPPPSSSRRRLASPPRLAPVVPGRRGASFFSVAGYARDEGGRRSRSAWIQGQRRPSRVTRDKETVRSTLFFFSGFSLSRSSLSLSLSLSLSARFAEIRR
jgi:hypothetical protein